MEMDQEGERLLSKESDQMIEDEILVKGLMPDDRRWLSWILVVIISIIAAFTLSAIIVMTITHYRSTNSDYSSAKGDRYVHDGRYWMGSTSYREPLTRYFDFNITQSYHSPDGFNKSMFLVNNLYPGPTIEANDGDRIVIRVNNFIEQSTLVSI
jgi:hypothetical protein